ncbi:MAG: RlmE family RNA methyltransferase [Thermodesulfobacteriota bacterium]|nr:RlmE family RNA methyltransferase [Thermodesulfobacteriota bacterium]
MARKKNTKRSRPDHYTQKAKSEQFPARSVYKLKEIQKKFNIIKKGDTIVDLGCAPGSWLLLASQLTGPGGSVTGIDIKPVAQKLPANTTVLATDIFQMDAALLPDNPDVIISDMAPDTTGNKFTDAARSFNLAVCAFDLCQNRLKPGGHFVCKVFQGEDFKNFTDMVKDIFERCKIFKPETCRRDSRETYVIGLSKKET